MQKTILILTLGIEAALYAHYIYRPRRAMATRRPHARQSDLDLAVTGVGIGCALFLLVAMFL